ncbi:NUDIX hydrolase [Phaeobacter sp. HF9A]|uniref:NUDIX hydrolase n=1 Tax=Phaeobacter sp. HF9A TaxID=2721561 RepID=UPI00143103F6|nr:NUDIX hydrolase [Phaeobacter sp. HF9A]NIZ15446.1 NUDIX domain-containing protein [Phaeobacter sp. HF9A]
MPFKGAKLALFLGPHLLVILRDDIAGIPFPGHWDFPGGGREGDETPEACVLRETYEEVGLALAEADLSYARRYATPDGASWFFAAHLGAHHAADIRFGDEGQGWELMTPGQYSAHPLGIPNFKTRLQDYLGAQPHVRA